MSHNGCAFPQQRAWVLRSIHGRSFCVNFTIEQAQHVPTQVHKYNACCRLVLDKNVKEKALELRSKYMKTLEELFQERQQLNIKAVKVLLPPEVGVFRASLSVAAWHP